MRNTIYASIQASKIAAVDAAIDQTITEPIIEITLLSGGFSEASVFRIITATHAYILKVLPDAVSENAGIFLKYKLAAGAGVAPKLYYADESQGILLTESVKTQPVSTAFTTEEFIAALGSHIKTLHGVVLTIEDDKMDVRNIFDQTINWFAEHGFLTGALKDETFANYVRAIDTYPWNDTDATVFCHNDLNPRNVLCDGKQLWLIDWDASSMNDKYVDLAIAANFFAPTPELEKLLLQQYFNGIPTTEQSARFYTIKPLCQLVYTAKFLQMALQNKPANAIFNHDPYETDMSQIGMLLRNGTLSLDSYEGQRLYGKAMLNGSLRQLNSAHFIEQLLHLGGD